MNPRWNRLMGSWERRGKADGKSAVKPMTDRELANFMVTYAKRPIEKATKGTVNRVVYLAGDDLFWNAVAPDMEKDIEKEVAGFVLKNKDPELLPGGGDEKWMIDMLANAYHDGWRDGFEPELRKRFVDVMAQLESTRVIGASLERLAEIINGI